ncbi:DUF2316 family protein [Staphylococcus intermedius]|uniref:DUF2316 family protein n=1 Tax=Staphylococcus intermedius TaxID=1285 RepID=UPI000BBBED53|nr:DUF2316 family protein [Staphylococcus intermedius]PCF84976.1 hypothetical protein B4W76_10805 [Staphylococcus intermedius]
MSLNKAQRRVTSEELKAHFAQSTLTIAQIADKMHISEKQVENILNMDAPSRLLGGGLNTFIHQVWDLRDHINDNIKANGDIPAEYTYLKGEKEDYWFLQ